MDSRIRLAEREDSDGHIGAEVRVLRERLRGGQLDPSRVAVSAALGCAAAIAIGLPQLDLPPAEATSRESERAIEAVRRGDPGAPDLIDSVVGAYGRRVVACIAPLAAHEQVAFALDCVRRTADYVGEAHLSCLSSCLRYAEVWLETKSLPPQGRSAGEAANDLGLELAGLVDEDATTSEANSARALWSAASLIEALGDSSQVGTQALANAIDHAQKGAVDQDAELAWQTSRLVAYLLFPESL